MIRVVAAGVVMTLASTAVAQTSIGPNGIRSGSTVVDSRGVHTDTTDVDSTGVHDRTGPGATVIRTNRNTRAVTCSGRPLNVAGNGNHVSASGCSTVYVNGNDNIVAAAFTRSGRLSVMGNHNRINWTAGPGVRIAVSNLGTGNQVARSR